MYDLFNKLYNKCRFELACLRDINRRWSRTRKLLAVLLVVLSITYVLYIFLYPKGEESQHIVNSIPIIALLVTSTAFYLSVVLYESLELLLGIEEYTIQAAKRYLGAQKWVLGVLRYWKVGPVLQEALLNCDCNKIVFVGKVEAENIPGVLWRLSLNSQRRERGLQEMEIYHVKKTPFLFVVIDEDTVLVEQRDVKRGRVFDSDKELADAYKEVFENFYAPPHHVREAEKKVMMLVHDWIKDKCVGKFASLEDLQDLIIRETRFNSNKEYLQYIKEQHYRTYIQELLRKLPKSYPKEFQEQKAVRGGWGLIIQSREG